MIVRGVYLVCFLFLLVACSSIDEGSDHKVVYKNYSPPLDQLISADDDIAIHVIKSEYVLHIVAADTIVKSYPIVLGKNPIDDKRCEGDMCTPEGKFYIRDKYPHKSWNKFLWVDYPSKESWQKPQNAKSKGLIPEDATIGSEVGIHGVPEGKDYLVDEAKNWTWGCVSMKNKDVEEIYPYVVVNKTPIIIKP